MSITALLKISAPIIQAPMAGVQDYRLAVAVARAGGLGSIPCAMLSITQMLAQITAFQKQQSGSYNLNFFCHSDAKNKAAQLTAWRETLHPYFEEFQVEEPQQASPARTPFNQQIVDALAPLAPPVLSFHFGLPEPKLLEQVKAWGAIIISSATSVNEGLWLEQQGADIVIAQGLEAGGHRAMFMETDITQQLTTFSLVPQLVDSLKIPVIAAGGIADSQGIQAALNLGAKGVQIGTSYLLCDEANTSNLHRRALVSEHAQHTCLTNVFSGRPARGIVNRAITELGPINDSAPNFPLAAIAMTKLRSAAEKAHSSDFSPLWCGQNVRGCRNISATELTRELMSAFKD